MTFRLVDAGWASEFESALGLDSSGLCVVCPFIKIGAVTRLLSSRPGSIRVITRFNLSDFAEGVSDLSALQRLHDVGAKIRGIRNLHAKLYLFGKSRAVVTSANLTEAGLGRNHEFGMITNDAAAIGVCQDYFDNLWWRAGTDLQPGRLSEWQDIITAYRAAGGRPNGPTGLADFGAEAGIGEPPRGQTSMTVTDAAQAFVKFLGNRRNRVPSTCPTIEELNRAGCHWALAYPKNKRPRSVENGAVMYIARLVEGRDIRVFGRGIGMEYISGRDDAAPADIERRSWKSTWPHYVRVHNTEFVAGTMQNGVSLNELMEALGPDSFVSTQRNAETGSGNTDPRRAYMRQAAVRLSAQGFAWLDERLEDAFRRYDKIPRAELDRLDWPDIPDIPDIPV
ncbi:MAG: phospholipase D family protein [Alphaproteobacteria bacterium]|nr:phospholipase D family protein [Alphaproteobacteria bacterium]